MGYSSQCFKTVLGCLNMIKKTSIVLTCTGTISRLAKGGWSIG